MSYVVAAEARIDVEHEEEAWLALSRLVENSRKEPGNILYRVHQAVDDPALVMFYEEFQEKGSFDSHCKSQHYLDYKRDTKGLIENLSARAYMMSK